MKSSNSSFLHQHPFPGLYPISSKTLCTPPPQCHSIFGGSYPHTPFHKGGWGVPSMLHMSVQTLCLEAGRWGDHVGAFLKQISCLSANPTEI